MYWHSSLGRVRLDQLVDDVRRALDCAGDHGFTCDVDILFGLPGETEEDVELTFTLMDEVFAAKGRTRVHVFTPLPGTPFEHEPPGSLSDEARSRLGQLALDGRVTGAWGWQEMQGRSEDHTT